MPEVCLGRESQGRFIKQNYSQELACSGFSSEQTTQLLPGRTDHVQLGTIVLCPSRCSDFNPVGPRTLSKLRLRFSACRNITSS